MAEAAKIAAYEEKLKSTTRETFQDRPDEVCNIYIEKSMDTSVTISEFIEPEILNLKPRSTGNTSLQSTP